MNTLYLTKEERAVFQGLKPELRDGELTVKDEVLTYEDNDMRRGMRLEGMKLEDPVLHSFLLQMKTVESPEDFAKLFLSIDLRTLAESDAQELFFALGPDAMTHVIGRVLRNASTVEDIQACSAFSEVRHGLLESFASSSAMPS